MSEERRPPRWQKRVLVATGFLVAIYVLRLVLGLGLGAIHFSNTPDFETYLRSNPVDADRLDTALAGVEGNEDSSTLFWGEVDPMTLDPEDETVELRAQVLEVDIQRGEKYILRYRQEFALALDRETWDRQGMRVTTPLLVTGEDLRVIAIVRLTPPERMIGEGSNGEGHAVVDVILAAGEGGPRVRFGELTEDPAAGDVSTLLAGAEGLPPLEQFQLELSWFRWLLGLVHPSDEIAEAGLLHHVSVPVFLNWEKLQGGHGGPSFRDVRHWLSTKQYSFTLRVAVSDIRDGESAPSIETSHYVEYRWNDELW